MTRDGITYPQTVRIIDVNEDGAKIRYRDGHIKEVVVLDTNMLSMAAGQFWAIYDINPETNRLIAYERVS